MAEEKEKNMVSYKFDGQKDDAVIEKLICDALVKL